MRIGDRILHCIRQDMSVGLLLILSQGITRASLQNKPSALRFLFTTNQPQWAKRVCFKRKSMAPTPHLRHAIYLILCQYKSLPPQDIANILNSSDGVIWAYRKHSGRLVTVADVIACVRNQNQFLVEFDDNGFCQINKYLL